MIKLDKKKLIIIVFIIIVIGIAYYIFSNDFNVVIQKFEEIDEKEDSLKDKSNNEKDENIKDKEINIVVHVSGAVVNEGIVELKEGSRITDAIEKAGGLKEDACIKDINLAEILEDGIKISIPTVDEYNKNEENINEVKSNNIGQNNSKTISKKKNIKININTATQSELETLPGIGSSIALKIINYRKENGKFNSIEDIKNVRRNR